MGSLRGEDARRGLLIVGVMTVHSAAEGIGVGAAFGGGATFGLVIAIAIAIHNIPEGLAISLVLVPRGTSVTLPRDGASSPASRSRYWPCPHSCSSTRSHRFSRSGWDSQQAPWCGWSSASSSRKRWRWRRDASSPASAVLHSRSCSPCSACFRNKGARR